ncbi:MAG: glycoside hydrolase family 27 protein [Eubacteriales bacterium]
MKKAATPYMGWNSWDCYGAAVNEDIVRANAEFMAANLKKYGWEYIVVDIQWYEPTASSHNYNAFPELAMDGFGRLIPAENRFPSSANGAGFRPLADYIHSLGLKFGIHIMRGIPRDAVHRRLPVKGSSLSADKIADASSICGWNGDMYGVNPSRDGAREYYASIFELYAEWGVDFIKCDDIAREMPRCEDELRLLSDAMKNCGRDIVLSLSPGPAKLEFAQLYRETSNMWRITDDFWDSWQLLYSMFERCEKWSIHTSAGHFPDADMLPIGPIRQIYGCENHTIFTVDEQITMLNLWCIFRSPLMIGGDMTRFDGFTMSLLTNPELIEMSQKSRHAHQVWRKKSAEGCELVLWTAVKADGGQYAAIFNVGEVETEAEISLCDLETELNHALNLWTKEESDAEDGIRVKLRPHESAAFLLT